MEQFVDMMAIGCMGLICAFAVQEEPTDATIIDSTTHVQRQAEVIPVHIVGLSAMSFALLPADIANALTVSSSPAPLN